MEATSLSVTLCLRESHIFSINSESIFLLRGKLVPAQEKLGLFNVIHSGLFTSLCNLLASYRAANSPCKHQECHFPYLCSLTSRDTTQHSSRNTVMVPLWKFHILRGTLVQRSRGSQMCRFCFEARPRIANCLIAIMSAGRH